MNFPEENFEIIWSEGSIQFIGFERGITGWRRFLKTNGFLVIHDAVKGLANKLKQIPKCGYETLGHFKLPENAWWVDYCPPLKKRIHKLRMKHSNNPKALKILDREQHEVDMYKKDPELFRSVFFIMQKSK